MTTFIDFRYSRALAAALFAGQEKEETEITFAPGRETCIALHVGNAKTSRCLATLTDGVGITAALAIGQNGEVSLNDGAGRCLVSGRGPFDDGLIGLRLGPSGSGLKTNGIKSEAGVDLFQGTNGGSSTSLRLDCAEGVSVMGRGSGRAARWGELFYHRTTPSGLCVELTMDWHHLRAGIPFFSTMTAEELLARGKHRLRFRSYAFEASDAEMTDFVRLFGCDDPPDIAVHLTPALYDLHRQHLPNLGFAVIESEHVHAHLVERCNNMDRICVPSRFTRAVFLRAGVTRPIDVVLHGVDTEYFHPVGRKQPLPGGRGFNFLTVTTHVERKNVKHLVRAFLEEFRDSDDVALFLLLRPEYHTTQNNVALEFTEWERSWARDSAPIFLWTGYVTRDHLRDFYTNADAYVMPSNEGFGLTLLEAMASGTPVIGLQHGGVLDFLTNENGILVPSGRPYVSRDVDTLPYIGDLFHEPSLPELRSAMRRLFENRDLGARLAARGRAAAESLSWPAVTLDMARCIERTYDDFHRLGRGPHGNVSLAPLAPAALSLTFVLCVVDDEDASKSLDYLHDLAAGRRVLCLFTRYARVRDVMRARRYGFAYYRWDGTIDNCKIIARSILGQSWIIVLYAQERVSCDQATLIDVLSVQSESVTEVAVQGPAGVTEPRLFHVRPHGEPSGKTEYAGISIRRLAR